MKIRQLTRWSLNPRITEDSSLPVGYIRNAYYNGVGRYVCQLQRVTIKFCKNSGTSQGVRDFIEHNLIDFTRKNPGVAIYMKPRLHKTPIIVAEYLNGESQWMNIRRFTATEVNWWLDIFRTRSGYELSQLILDKNVITPSVQGVWNPFLNRPTNLLGKDFPIPERSAFVPEVPSATQQLLNIVEKYKLSALDETQISEEK